MRENIAAFSDTNVAYMLHGAFNRPCRGDIVQNLRSDLRTYESTYDPELHSGKIIAMAQSSAYGKTYSMYQLAKEELSVCVCFRGIMRDVLDDPPGPSEGWPPQDLPICEVLRWWGKVGGWTEEAAASFLGALFYVMARKLEGSQTIAEFNAHWKLDTPAFPEDSRRHATFEEVAEATQSIRKGSMIDYAEMRRTKDITQDAQKNFAYETSVKPHLADLHSVLSASGLGDFIVIALDECSQLDSVPARRGPPVPYLKTLRSLIKKCESFPCWFFLLDTKPSILQREVWSVPRMPEPWPYLGYDIMVKEAFTAGMSSPRDALNLEHLKYYGRPFWSSIDINYLLDTAMVKLQCSIRYYDPHDPLVVLTALSARILISMADNDLAQGMEESTVYQHMRTIVGVSKSSKLLTKVPSEPMLAIAAGSCMTGLGSFRKSGPQYELYKKTMSTFVDNLVLIRDVIDRRSLAPTAVRAYITMARDAALQGSSFVQDVDNFVRPVSLLDFFSSFLAKDTHGDLPADLQDFVINFTHFTQLSANVLQMSPEMLYRAWCRGSALQGAHGQPIWDILLPAYHKDHLDEPFDVKHCYLVAIKIKNNSNPFPTAELAAGLTVPFII